MKSLAYFRPNPKDDKLAMKKAKSNDFKASTTPPTSQPSIFLQTKMRLRTILALASALAAHAFEDIDLAHRKTFGIKWIEAYPHETALHHWWHTPAIGGLSYPVEFRTGENYWDWRGCVPHTTGMLDHVEIDMGPPEWHTIEGCARAIDRRYPRGGDVVGNAGLGMVGKNCWFFPGNLVYDEKVMEYQNPFFIPARCERYRCPGNWKQICGGEEGWVQPETNISVDWVSLFLVLHSAVLADQRCI